MDIIQYTVYTLIRECILYLRHSLAYIVLLVVLDGVCNLYDGVHCLFSSFSTAQSTATKKMGFSFYTALFLYLSVSTLVLIYCLRHISLFLSLSISLSTLCLCITRLSFSQSLFHFPDLFLGNNNNHTLVDPPPSYSPFILKIHLKPGNR